MIANSEPTNYSLKQDRLAQKSQDLDLKSTRSDSMPALQLGVLDIGLITPGKTAANVIQETLSSVSLADSLGYSRYWLTEHHDPGFAWASPEIMLTLIARQSDRIRIGTAGILLYFYSPLRIAEIVRLLEVLYPQRIDLGITSGIADKATIKALAVNFDLQQALKNNLYDEKVTKLIDFLTNNFPANHHFAAGATPTMSEVPPIWLMGAGKGRNLRLAAEKGTAFSYSLYHAFSKQEPQVLQEYRSRFQPNSRLSEPKCNLAVSVVCGETEAEAKKQQILVEKIDRTSRVNVVGTPEQCQEQLLEIQHQYQVSEIIIISSWHLFARRQSSYQMLSEVLDLPATKPTP